MSRWMCRSSTTVSWPTAPRRYGEKLLQNSSDNTRPRAPAAMRMIPTVLMLNPDAVTSTAKVRTAPTASRKMLTPRLKLLASRTMLRSRRDCLLSVRFSAASADLMSRSIASADHDRLGTAQEENQAVGGHGTHDGGVVGVAGHVEHERLVELDLVDREPFQVRQRRVAGP